jgi:hypothetical protein
MGTFSKHGLCPVTRIQILAAMGVDWRILGFNRVEEMAPDPLDDERFTAAWADNVPFESNQTNLDLR